MGHRDATCYFIHPELRKEREEKYRGYTQREFDRARRGKDLPKAKVAYVSSMTNRAKDDEIRALED